jgi:hypothetical protein
LIIQFWNLFSLKLFIIGCYFSENEQTIKGAQQVHHPQKTQQNAISPTLPQNSSKSTSAPGSPANRDNPLIKPNTGKDDLLPNTWQFINNEIDELDRTILYAPRFQLHLKSSTPKQSQLPIQCPRQPPQNVGFRPIAKCPQSG